MILCFLYKKSPLITIPNGRLANHFITHIKNQKLRVLLLKRFDKMSLLRQKTKNARIYLLLHCQRFLCDHL